MSRQIIALGGGGFSMEPQNPLLDQYILRQAAVSRPKICFFPHATDDASRYALNFYAAFSKWNAQPSHLSMYTPHTADLEGFLLDQHIIYVGGGNTKSMLAVWREWNLDKILYKAYQNGTVLAGISAGANCWFEQCNTDSVPGPYTMLPALGFIKGSFCPHYDGEPNRRPSMHALIHEGVLLPGLAADNSAAVHLVDEKVFASVSSVPGAKTYKVSVGSEEALPTTYLGGS